MRRNLSTLWGKAPVVSHQKLVDYTRTAPTIGSTVEVEDPLYMSGTLDIYRTSDNHKYVPDTDFEEVAPNKFTNLAITAGTTIKVEYFMDLTDAGGVASAVTVPAVSATFQWRGAWNSGTSYVENDLVFYAAISS